MKNFQSGIVALIGLPNAGKSTLLNALVGEKLAIVSPKPQTTRNQISGILSDDGRQIVFLDTPGIHRHKGQMNKALVDGAWNALVGADVIVFVLDAERYVRKPEKLQSEIRPLFARLEQTGLPLLIVLNKVDLLKDKSVLLPLMAELSAKLPFAEICPLSAAQKDGLDDLLTALSLHLPECPPIFPPDQLSTLPVRFMAAEIIREKLFLALEKEVPYYCFVEIETWDEQSSPVHIGAVIFVATQSHKAIVIGKGGSRLKEIGQAARKEIVSLLGQKIFLELWVRVNPKWTEDAQILNTFRQNIL